MGCSECIPGHLVGWAVAFANFHGIYPPTAADSSCQCSIATCKMPENFTGKFNTFSTKEQKEEYKIIQLWKPGEWSNKGRT